MRDPKRIDRICEKLKLLWKKNPNWRLGQFLINHGLAVDDVKVWNLEDTDIERGLDIRIGDEEKAYCNFCKKETAVIKDSFAGLPLYVCSVCGSDEDYDIEKDPEQRASLSGT